MDKSEWFKKVGKRTEEDATSTKNVNSSWGGRVKRQKVLQSSLGTSLGTARTRTVLFVEQTPGGKLARSLREVLKRIEGILGFKVKVVERTGSTLKNLLPNTNPWGGAHCTRAECVTCNQGSEDMPACTKRGLVYESICLSCNPGALQKGELKIDGNNTTPHPSIYVGETCRSIQERAAEHQEAYNK